jgi:hypothetical protein
MEQDVYHAYAPRWNSRTSGYNPRLDGPIWRDHLEMTDDILGHMRLRWCLADLKYYHAFRASDNQ